MRKFFALLMVAGFALTVVPTYAADAPKADAPKAEKKKPDPEAAFKRLDKDGDGSITEAEFVGKQEGEKATKAKEIFAARDTNKDGKISLEEFKTKPAKKPKAK